MRLKMAGRQHNSRFVFELHGDAARGGTADGHVEKHLLLNANDTLGAQFLNLRPLLVIARKACPSKLGTVQYDNGSPAEELRRG